MPKIKYHCEVCNYPYDTEEEAGNCEKQGVNRFLFEVGDVFEPKSGMLKPEEAMSFHTRDVVITGRSRYPQKHENVYNIPDIRTEPVGESYLKNNYKKVGSGGLRD